MAGLFLDLRADLLTPLATKIRESNLDFGGLTDAIRQVVFDALGGLLLNQTGPGTVGLEDVVFRLLNDDRTAEANIFTAKAAQFDFTIHKTYTFDADEIAFDVGIPVLGLEAKFKPQITISFDLKLGFGVHLDKGFYFVTDDAMAGGETTDEMSCRSR